MAGGASSTSSSTSSTSSTASTGATSGTTSRTNKDFIDFLKVYGPWTGSDNQYEEQVSRSAWDNNVVPFEYDRPYRAYLQELHLLLASGKSQAIFISGCAGDGKTHFLHQIFVDPEIIGRTEQEWIECLDHNEGLWRFTQNGVHYTLVPDLTTLSDDHDIASLMQEVSIVLGLCAAPSDLAASYKNERHLVFIAGNNGKILERFHQLLSEQVQALRTRAQELVATATATASATAAIAGDSSGAGAVETVDLAPEYVALLRSQFSEISTVQLQLLQQHCAADLSYTLNLLRFIQKLEDKYLSHEDVTFDQATIFDMTNTITKELIEEIMVSVLCHDNWQRCVQCSVCGQCPIVRNRNLLLSPCVLQRYIKLLAFISASGVHFTIRNLLLVVVNAILGCEKSTSSSDSTFMTCQKVVNQISGRTKTKIVSNPYDNLLGLNLFGKRLQDSPVYTQLATVALGQSTTKLIDNFILFGNLNAFQKEQYAHIVSEHDHFGLELKLKQALSSLHQSDLGDDNSADLDLGDSTAATSLAPKRRGRKSAAARVAAEQEEANLSNLSAIMQALRRVIFFTIGGSATVAGTAVSVPVPEISAESLLQAMQHDFDRDLPFSPYVFTPYRFVPEFFSLLSKVRAMQQVESELQRLPADGAGRTGAGRTGGTGGAVSAERSALLQRLGEARSAVRRDESASRLILGLNRAFTTLMTVADNEEVFISSNNKVNPTALCVLTSQSRFRLRAHEYVAGTINIDCSHDHDKLMTLSFYDHAEAQYVPKSPRIDFKLTPKRFEYLMALSYGFMGLSYSPECGEELNSFKASIASRLERYMAALDYNVPSDAGSVISTIKFCELNEVGLITPKDY